MPSPRSDSSTAAGTAQAMSPEATPTPIPVPTRTPTPLPTPTPTLSEIVEQVRPAIVRVRTDIGHGSGVIYEAHDGFAYVVTNYHVIQGAPQVQVTVNDSLGYPADVLGFDQFLDLAVVRIRCSRCETASLAHPVDPKVGMEVAIVGYPSGSVSGQASVSRGIVSAIGSHPDYPEDTIQTDAAINPGNSGGPMLSRSGHVLGVNTFKWITHSDGTVAEGLGFAIPATTVYPQVLWLEQGVFVEEVGFEVPAGQEFPIPWEMRTGAKLTFDFPPISTSTSGLLAQETWNWRVRKGRSLGAATLRRTRKGLTPWYSIIRSLGSRANS